MYQNTVLEFLNMGGGEMMLIGVAILMLFGGKKLPELARGLGKGIREFKDASEGVKREIHRNINSVSGEDDDKNLNIVNARENDNERHHPTESDIAVETPVADEILLNKDSVKEEEVIKVENKSSEIHS